MSGAQPATEDEEGCPLILTKRKTFSVEFEGIRNRRGYLFTGGSRTTSHQMQIIRSARPCERAPKGAAACSPNGEIHRVWFVGGISDGGRVMQY